MRTVTVYYSGHQHPSHTGSGVKSYHLQMRTVKDVNTSVKLSLSRAQCLSTERAYIALPQRLSICKQKLLFHLTFFMSAEVSTEQLLFSCYRIRKFYCLLDPTSTNIAPSPSKRVDEFAIGILRWDVRALPWDIYCTIQLWNVGQDSAPSPWVQDWIAEFLYLTGLLCNQPYQLWRAWTSFEVSGFTNR